MKKSILLVTLCFSLSLVLSSCKGEKKEAPEASESTEMNENLAADKADIAMNDAYQCPMGCEDGKIYHQEGECPVCNMTLKKVEKEEEGTHQHEDGEKHEDQE
jgi:heavy metal-binding protein